MNLSWTFREFGNFIIGKSEKNEGVLQISLAFKLESKENFKNLLLEFAGLELDSKIEFHSGKLFGTDYFHFDLVKNNETARYWCAMKPKGLILAVYSTKNSYFDSGEIEDCTNILMQREF